jgi:hypothetical protein
MGGETSPGNDGASTDAVGDQTNTDAAASDGQTDSMNSDAADAADSSTLDAAAAGDAAADGSDADAGQTCAQCTIQTGGPGGACASQWNTRSASSACVTLWTCVAACAGDQTCAQNCYNAASSSTQAKYNAVVNCLCTTAGCDTVCPHGCAPGF